MWHFESWAIYKECVFFLSIPKTSKKKKDIWDALASNIYAHLTLSNTYLLSNTENLYYSIDLLPH